MKRFSIDIFIIILALVAAFAVQAQQQQPCITGAPPSAGVPPVDGAAPACTGGTRHIECNKNGGYLYTFSVTNSTGAPVTSVLITPPLNAGYSISPQMPPLPGGVLANGATTTLTVVITGGQPGQTICFPVTLMSAEKGCCTVQVCVDLPNCCATFKDLKVECNKDGSYNYTFSITNNTPGTVQHIYLYAPAGTAIAPNYFAVNLASGATSPPLTVRITGAAPGRFCFRISLHTENMKTCCAFEHCIGLPKCGTDLACANGVCCSRAPAYDGTKFTGQKVAVVTGNNQSVAPAQNFVLTAFDISGANGFGVNGNGPPAGNTATSYTGPSATPWNAVNLGAVFGVDIDHLGNIYVAASSAFSTDPIAAGGPGAVYKIDYNSGAIHTFAQLPNSPDPNGGFASLGDVAFDCRRKQFYVTNEDDGRIYRLDMNGTVLSAYDHATGTLSPNGAPEPGDQPGFAPLGERLWAVQVHNNRVYYSVWAEDCGERNSNPAVKNEIWSVALDVTGDFDPGDRRLEISIPDLAGENFSDPASDIAFSRDGRMLLAERSMSSATQPTAHASRVLEYLCENGKWVLAPPVSGLPYKYNVGVGSVSGLCAPGGSAAKPANAAGGVDYDYDPAATYQTWATGDILFAGSYLIYGFQGFQPGGGKATTSPLLALYGQGSFKTEIGDIEVSCPSADNPY